MSKRLTGLNPLAYIGVEPTEPVNTYMSPLAPTPTDVKNFNLGDFWVDTETEILYCLVSQQRGVAVWIPLSGGGSGGAVNFVTPNGTAVESGGNILIQGDGTTITTSGSGDTVTFSATGNFPTPITVPNGGTGNSSFVPYEVVAGGTTSTSPLQQVSGLGTSGFVLTSNGPGTLPTWQASAGSGGGSLTLIQSQTAASATSLVFTTGITTAYDNFLIVFDGFNNPTASGANNLLMQLSTNGGSSYIASGYLQGTNALAGLIVAFVGNASSSSEIANGAATVFGLTSGGSTIFPSCLVEENIYPNGVGNAGSGSASSSYTVSNTVVNAFKLVMADASAFSGTFSVYGYSLSSGSNPPGTFHTNSGDATTAANAITIVGTGGITTSGSGSTVTINGGNVPLLTRLTLTSSQIKNLAGSPITLISAPGAGNLVIMRGIDVMMSYGGNNPFTASNPSAQIIILYYNTNTNGNQSGWGVMSLAQYTQSNSVFSVGLASGGNASALTAAGMENEPIVIGIDSGAANIGGNAANDNTISIVAYYEIVDVATYF